MVVTARVEWRDAVYRGDAKHSRSGVLVGWAHFTPPSLAPAQGR